METSTLFEETKDILIAAEEDLEYLRLLLNEMNYEQITTQLIEFDIKTEQIKSNFHRIEQLLIKNK